MASVAYTFVPNIGPFWVVDGLTAGTAQTIVTWRYLVLVTGYASLLIVAALAVAIAAFQKREVG